MQTLESYCSDCYLPYFHCCQAALRSTVILWTCPFLLHLLEQGEGSRHPGSHFSTRVLKSLIQKSQNGDFHARRFHCGIFNRRYFFHRPVSTAQGKGVSNPWDSVQSCLSCPAHVALGEVTARSPGHSHQRCLLVCLISSRNSKVLVQGQRHFGSLKVHVDPSASQCDTLEL